VWLTIDSWKHAGVTPVLGLSLNVCAALPTATVGRRFCRDEGRRPTVVRISIVDVAASLNRDVTR
jgi:hypothetical protein